MIGLEEKFVSLLKRTLNLISSDVMFSIVNEVSDWNVEFAVIERSSGFIVTDFILIGN